MIQLARGDDGRLIIASNQDFPADVRRVEYYREQKLFNLVFEGMDESEGQLLPCEVSASTARIIETSPDIAIIAMAQNGGKPYGYLCPLVQIGF